MTIKKSRETGDWVLSCNSCKTREVFAPSTAFHRIIRWIAEQGWKARNLFDRWRHYCPKCDRALREYRLDKVVDRERLHA